MAYLAKEVVKQVREELTTKYPTKKGWKFSIRNRDSSNLCVRIVSAPMAFYKDDEKLSAEENKRNHEYMQVNHYYLNHYENEETLRDIVEICNRTNFDKSDIQTDYFHVGYYFSLSVGDWDKPFINTSL